MKSTIPVHREKIKEASKSDLNDFLENVRRISPMIGEKAMKHVSIFLIQFIYAMITKPCFVIFPY